MKNKVSVKRKTTETEIKVSIDKSELKQDYRRKIKTPIPFLNHMIEHIAYRAALNIEIEMEFDEFELTHLVCEDVAMTLGRAVYEYVKSNVPIGFGSAVGIIDEARALAAVSFEDRSQLVFNSDVNLPDVVEGIPGEELITFLDGFAQGARCTLHIDIQSGKNSHHIWEAVYRAFGMVLGQALSVSKYREGLTAGVAGEVIYEVKFE